ncbi:hypothetical protein GCM10010392_38840 [Streptomyces clavifer]|nr:hypothetical protein GCM10010392_38840 [Streptomyces clavifer]
MRTGAPPEFTHFMQILSVARDTPCRVRRAPCLRAPCLRSSQAAGPSGIERSGIPPGSHHPEDPKDPDALPWTGGPAERPGGRRQPDFLPRRASAVR